MQRMVVLGAGVMGSALCVPAADNGLDVTLVGTHLDHSIIESLKSSHYHPALDAKLPDSIRYLQIDELTAEHLMQVDLFVIGVSSPGMDWAIETIRAKKTALSTLALITKGLEPDNDAPALTYADALPVKLAAQQESTLEPITFEHLVGIGGPCIARELALRQPTAVVFGCVDNDALVTMANALQTDYYRIKQSADVKGIEACAPLKNFFAIGVSATLGHYATEKNQVVSVSKNPTAAYFNQAVVEMAALAEWLGGRRDTAYDLAGMGDLHVTVGGGRNSRLGTCLGQGLTISEAMAGPLQGQTVEGIDTGRVLSAGFRKAIDNGELRKENFPLTTAILDCIEFDCQFGLCHQLF